MNRRNVVRVSAKVARTPGCSEPWTWPEWVKRVARVTGSLGGQIEMRKLVVTTVVVAASVVSMILAGSAAAHSVSGLSKAYLPRTEMQNLIDTRGVSFTGFAHLNGYHVNVDIAKCLGLRRYGVRVVSGRTLFYGFKCSITTDDESRFTLWVFARSRTRFYVESARLDYSSTAVVEDCLEWGLEWGGDWAVCLGKYRP